MWQVMIKGSLTSPLLIVQPHIFCRNSFVWPSLSSFEWSAFPGAAGKTYIFPANDVSPTVPGWFSHSMQLMHGGGHRQSVCCKWSWAWCWLFLLSADRQAPRASVYGGSHLRRDVFSPLLYKDRSACEFCLSTFVLDQVPVCDSETTLSIYFIKMRINKYKSIKINQ